MNLNVDTDNAQALLSSLQSCVEHRPQLPEAPLPSPGFSHFTTAARLAISGVDRRQGDFRTQVQGLIDMVQGQLMEVIETDHVHGDVLRGLYR